MAIHKGTLFYLQATMDLATKHASDPSALKVIFSSIVLICKIFYSLNFQVSVNNVYSNAPMMTILNMILQ